MRHRLCALGLPSLLAVLVSVSEASNGLTSSQLVEHWKAEARELKAKLKTKDSIIHALNAKLKAVETTGSATSDEVGEGSSATTIESPFEKKIRKIERLTPVKQRKKGRNLPSEK